MTLAPEPAQTAIVRTGVARLEPWPSARRSLLNPRWVFVRDTASSRLKGVIRVIFFLIFLKYMNGQRPGKKLLRRHMDKCYFLCVTQLCCILTYTELMVGKVRVIFNHWQLFSNGKKIC
jgi:hypothetical protein